MHETQVHRAPATSRPLSNVPRRRRSWRRRLVLFFVLVVVVLAVAVLSLWLRLSAFNDSVSTEPAASTRLFGPLRGEEPVNILLLGHSPEFRDGAFLSDSIAVLSIDPERQHTTAISIPRDLWIENHTAIPGNGKVNEAFAVGYRAGGFEEAGRRATEVLEWVTGLELSGWIALDFDGFRQMVDAVGGVTVDNPTAFAWALGPDQHAAGVWEGEFPAGEIQLDGYAALQYSRVRYTSVPAESSDFARSARQQRLLSAVRDRIEVGPAGVFRGLALLDALEGDRFHSDMSVLDLMQLASHLQADERVQLAEGVILDATTNSVGQYVLVVRGRSAPDDMGPLRAFIATELNRP